MIMRKVASTLLAVTLVASPLLLPQSARAENGEIAAGVVGGLIGGALLGGALASRPAPPPPRPTTRRRRSMSKSLPAGSFASVIGTAMTGVSAASRFAIDRSNFPVRGLRRKKGHPPGGFFVLMPANLAA